MSNFCGNRLNFAAVLFSSLFGMFFASASCSKSSDSSSSETEKDVITFIGFPPGTYTGDDTDGTGTNARVSWSHNMTTDGTNLYLADTGNNKIRKIVLSTAQITTFAGPPQGTKTSGDIDGVGNTARFTWPWGIATDGTNLYVSDRMGNKIRKIVISTGAVTTLAGPAQGSTASGDTDATGNSARFNAPSGLATDGANLYVADNSNNKIRKIVISSGAVTTLAGPAQGTTTSGDTDGTGNAARFNSPYGITSDGTNLYVGDASNQKIRKVVISTGVVTTIAGPAAGSTTSGDTDAIGNNARFSSPGGVSVDGDYLYISDCGGKIRKMSLSTNAVTTLAGPPQGSSGMGDADGAYSESRFRTPCSLFVTGNYIYVSDSDNNKIRKIKK